MCSLKLSFLPSHSDEITKVKTFLSKCKLTTRTYLSFNDHVTAIKTHTQFILLVCPALCLYHSVIPITPTMLCSFLTSPHFHFIPVMLFSFCLCCVLCLMCPWHPFSLCVTCHLSLHSPQPNINIMDMSDRSVLKRRSNFILYCQTMENNNNVRAVSMFTSHELYFQLHLLKLCPRKISEDKNGFVMGGLRTCKNKLKLTKNLLSCLKAVFWSKLPFI